jgi:glucan phosphorylase
MITEEKWTVDDVHVQRGRVAVITYVEDFDWQWAPLLYSGVDLWLNTSKRPQEASGTSGIKAALNGVPSLSILDGCWIEGCLEGVTGWCFADRPELADDEAYQAGSLYDKLWSTSFFRCSTRTRMRMRRNAGRHSGQWFVFQYASHGVAIPR